MGTGNSKLTTEQLPDDRLSKACHMGYRGNSQLYSFKQIVKVEVVWSCARPSVVPAVAFIWEPVRVN